MKKIKFGPKTLLYPMPAVLVGAKVSEIPNFMTAAWCGIASHKPPAISVALQRKRYTLQGIKEQKTFSINVPSVDLVKKVDYCGLYSGEKKDKSQIFKIFYGTLESAPLILECPVNIECKVISYLDIGSHTLVVGEIVETYINENCITDEKADPKKINPLVYASGTEKYHRLGEEIASAFKIGKEK
jgi:flavin reductase (DIM6/NTAB) family NADH-FMN oxidoreductase RutF